MLTRIKTTPWIVFGRDHAREATVVSLRLEHDFTTAHHIEAAGMFSSQVHTVFLASIPDTAAVGEVRELLDMFKSMRPETAKDVPLVTEEAAHLLNRLLILTNGDSHVGSAKVQHGSR